MSGDCAQPANDAFQRLSRPERRPDVFVAGLAHELRTPLTILKGRLLGLRDGVIDPATGECERLLAQIDRLMRLVDDLGTLAKAQAGGLTLDLRNVDLARIADHLRRAIGGEAARAHVHLAIVAGAGTIRCDPIRLTQALAMLLRSALESISARRGAGCWQSQQVKLVLTVHVSGAVCASDDDDPWQIGLRPALAMALIKAHGGKVTVTRKGIGDEDLQILVALSAF
jgi:signal transduction histidine kinase